MNWLIQEDVFNENYLDDMEEALGNFGLARGNGYEVVKYIPFSNALYLPIMNRNRAIVYGSINLLNQVKKYTHWRPGACFNWNNFAYRNYFPYYHRYLYNRWARWMPLSQMLARVDGLFERPMWIKSDAGDKTWDGGVYEKRDFIEEVDFRISNGLDPNTTMVIDHAADPDFPIETEWRIFCIDKKIITGTQYHPFSEKQVSPVVPDYIYEYAQKVLDDVYYTPAPVFALDICETHDTPWVMELSPFNCAGFYAADIKKLVTEVHKYYVDKYYIEERR